MCTENYVTFAEYEDERNRVIARIRKDKKADTSAPTVLPEDYEEYTFPDGTRLRAPKITLV